MKLLGWLPLASLAASGALILSRCAGDGPELRQAHAVATTAVAQDQVDKGVAAAAAHASAQTLRIITTTEKVEHDVETAQGADTPLAPDVLSRFSAGVDLVRAQSGPGNASGPGPARDRGELPATR